VAPAAFAACTRVSISAIELTRRNSVGNLAALHETLSLRFASGEVSSRDIIIPLCNNYQACPATSRFAIIMKLPPKSSNFGPRKCDRRLDPPPPSPCPAPRSLSRIPAAGSQRTPRESAHIIYRGETNDAGDDVRTNGGGGEEAPDGRVGHDQRVGNSKQRERERERERERLPVAAAVVAVVCISTAA